MMEKESSNSKRAAKPRIRNLTSDDLEEIHRHDRDFPHLSPLISLLLVKKILIVIAIIIIYLAVKS